jgi:RecA/RadA recombinase
MAWRRYVLRQEDSRQLPIEFENSDWSGADLDGPAAPVSIPIETADTEISLELEADVLPSPAAAQAALPDVVEAPPPSPVEAPIPSVGSAEQISEGEPVLRESDLAYLRRQIEQGTVVLLTGAGFSLGAKDLKGNPLPTGREYAKELWNLCYAGEEFDSSSLQDIFEQAHRRHVGALRTSLATRFTVDSASLAGSYERWFSFPWLRAYTLNVDDLERSAQRRFDLPRPIHSVSAQTTDQPGHVGNALEVIHLNGIASDGPDKVTFSHDQYADRIAKQEPFYAQLAAEMLTRPFVFVGSPLEEPLLWAHIRLRGERSTSSENEQRPKSFLISPSLTRARADKLRAYNVVWVKTTADVFADNILATLEHAAAQGRAHLTAKDARDRPDERNIVEVTDVRVTAPARRTEFLLGEEPTWYDIASGRAVVRDEDAPRLEKVKAAALAATDPTTQAPIFAISGTAGTGKTTLLMRIALNLTAAGHRVAWVGAGAEVAPAILTRYYRGDARPRILIVDDAGRYGREMIPTLFGLARSGALAFVVVAVRSYHRGLLEAAENDGLDVKLDSIGPLSDGDIDRLIDALERENRLGELRQLDLAARRAVFREKAARQILVAMIEATSGERFEDRIVREWQGLEPTARFLYALISLATANGLSLTKDEVLLASSGGNRELDAIASLIRSHLITTDDSGRLQGRHRVIAEKLVDELTQRGTQLESLVIGLCRALAIKAEAGQRSSRRARALKWLLKHDRLLRLLGEIEPARNVYAALEDHLRSDYHFWLQRGCLELEAGDVRLAENFLQQSAALNAEDPLVETALAHMTLRKAIANPGAPGAGESAEAAFDKLRGLIASRGSKDPYPAHVFGSQSLGWCNRASLTPRARRTLLREAKDIVGKAVTDHRGRSELEQLFHDLRLAELKPI